MWRGKLAGNNFIFNAYKKNQANINDNVNDKDLEIMRDSLKNTQVEVEAFFPRKLSSKDLKDGKIIKTGDYLLALEVEKNGYSEINNLSGNR